MAVVHTPDRAPYSIIDDINSCRPTVRLLTDQTEHHSVFLVNTFISYAVFC